MIPLCQGRSRRHDRHPVLHDRSTRASDLSRRARRQRREPGTPGREGGLARRRPAPGTVTELAIDLPTLGLRLDETLLRRIIQHAKQLYMFDEPRQYQGSGTLFPKNWEEQGDLLDWLVSVLDLGEGGTVRTRQLYDASAPWVSASGPKRCAR